VSITGVITELEDDGWCSSCDRMTQVATLDENVRLCCVVCGDYLIFASEEEEQPSER
jgi:hypothetical protein